MSATSYIEMKSVWKQFGSFAALSDINLSIDSGHIVGLLGSNGAGKTTLLKHIVGLSLPSRGECLTYGVNTAILGEQELGKLGYVPQESDLVHWMRAGQFLKFISTFYPTWDFELQNRLVTEFNIDNTQRIGNLSTGQRQLLSVIAAVSYRPQLLILDEPAASLDPLKRIQFLDLLLDLIQDGSRTIVISSHILSDVEKIIDQVVVMDAGLILYNNSLDDFRSEYQLVTIRSLAGDLPEKWSDFSTNVRASSKPQAAMTVHNSKLSELLKSAEYHSWITETRPLTLEEAYATMMRGGIKR